MPELFEIYIVYKRRYINTLPFLFLYCQVTNFTKQRLVPPPCELDEAYASSSIPAHSLHRVKHDVVRSTERTQRVASLPSNGDRATVAGGENLVKFGHVDFEIHERTERQTDKHTDALITLLQTHSGEDRSDTQVKTLA